MADFTATRTGKGRGAALIGALAVYLKVAFIYPANNLRVMDAAEALLERIYARTTTRPWVSVRVVSERFLVQEDEVEVEGMSADWMREVFLEARLAGVEFGQNVDPPALFEFAKTLRHLRGRTKEDFTSRWPADHPTIRPFDLRFVGSHRVGDAARESGRTGLPGAEERVEGNLLQGSMQARTYQELAEDPTVQARLSNLAERARRAAEGAGDTTTLDLLPEITRLLPVEAHRDLSRARGIVLDVIAAAEAELLEAAEGRSLGGDADLGRLALATARRFFDVKEFGKREDAPDLPSERPGDREIEESLDDLLEEFEALPDSDAPSLGDEDADLPLELTGVHLHELIRMEEVDWDAPGIPELARLLREPTPAQLAILEEYVAPCFDGADDAERHWRVIEFLRRAGLMPLLQRGEVFTPELVSRAFPALFDLFLDSLDARSGEDEEKLRLAVAAIGRSRIEEEAPRLVGRDGLLDRRRMEVVLSGSCPELLPLARVIAERGGPEMRAPVAEYLRRIPLPPAESAALSAVDPPGWLPADYLRDLCKLGLTGGEDARVREVSFVLLRKFVNELADAPGQLDRRLYAIRAMRLVPSLKSMEFLEHLSRAGRFLSLGKAARAVRQAAAETLRGFARASWKS